MSGTIATVKSSKRTANGAELQVEVGDGDEQTVELVLPPGVDALPLPGDEVVLQESAGGGNEAAGGFTDPKNPGVAEEGEHRTYARDADGAVVAEIWAKRNGDVAITSLKAGGKILLGKVVIDQDGNIETPGDLTVKKDAAPVKSSTHTHPTAMGPSGPPNPGT